MGNKKNAGKAGKDEKDKLGLNQPGVDNTNMPPTGEDEAARAATQGRPNEDNPNEDRSNEELPNQGSADDTAKNKVDLAAKLDKKEVKKPTPILQKYMDTAKTIIEMMDSNKVSTLFENSHGEYFTTDNLAHLSEKGNKDKVKCHRRETLEIIINSVA